MLAFVHNWVFFCFSSMVSRLSFSDDVFLGNDIHYNETLRVYVELGDWVSSCGFGKDAQCGGLFHGW